MSKPYKPKAEAVNASEWEQVPGGWRYRPTGEFSDTCGGRRFSVLAADRGCGGAVEPRPIDADGEDDPITATAEGPSGAP